MKNNWSVEKSGQIVVGIVFIVGCSFLFIKEEYGYGVMLLLALFPLLKLDDLLEVAFGGFNAKFETSPEKIEEEIKENKQPVTNRNFARFQVVESKILSILQKRYEGELKTQVHFVYGKPDKPEFRYTPDGSLQTKDTLYFFEIKYILKPELAKSIVSKTIGYLNEVYLKLSPSIGNKKFIIKLILASGYDLSDMHFETPEGIEIEFFKV